MKILITGGAGFIGSHLTRELLTTGNEVTILDNFSPQVHGEKGGVAKDFEANVRVVVADIRNRDELSRALAKQEVVIHLAAETGTGQSMYQIERYQSVNIGGTAVLMELLMEKCAKSLEKVIVASSRAVYGEGKYLCPMDGIVFPSSRRVADMERGLFEPRCPKCDSFCESRATSEDSPLQPTSFYGLTKQVQEQMTLMFCRTLGVPAFALRYQNVYGPGQSLKNPYTGILAIFSNQARAHKPIYIFEDGNESRDFVYIDDVISATYACIKDSSQQACYALNVGGGIKTTVIDVVNNIKDFFASRSSVVVNGAFREGDIRHNLAELSLCSKILQFDPKWNFKDGVHMFLKWVMEQEPQRGRYEGSLAEMKSRGLLRE